MSKISHTISNRLQRKHRIRSVIVGSALRPRLTVTISNHHISAQLIDDSSHTTLAYASTIGKKTVSGTMTNKAAGIGTEIAKKAKTLNISKLVFDRNGKLYHGRVAALADAARKEGMEF